MIKRVPWLTVLLALQGFFFGCVDFIKNNDVLYTAMFAVGVEPVVFLGRKWIWLLLAGFIAMCTGLVLINLMNTTMALSLAIPALP